jgi:hypothetical protein
MTGRGGLGGRLGGGRSFIDGGGAATMSRAGVSPANVGKICGRRPVVEKVGRGARPTAPEGGRGPRDLGR